MQGLIKLFAMNRTAQLAGSGGIVITGTQLRTSDNARIATPTAKQYRVQ